MVVECLSTIVSLLGSKTLPPLFKGRKQEPHEDKGWSKLRGALEVSLVLMDKFGEHFTSFVKKMYQTKGTT